MMPTADETPTAKGVSMSTPGPVKAPTELARCCAAMRATLDQIESGHADDSAQLKALQEQQTKLQSLVTKKRLISEVEGTDDDQQQAGR